MVEDDDDGAEPEDAEEEPEEDARRDYSREPIILEITGELEYHDDWDAGLRYALNYDYRAGPGVSSGSIGGGGCGYASLEEAKERWEGVKKSKAAWFGFAHRPVKLKSTLEIKVPGQGQQTLF